MTKRINQIVDHLAARSKQKIDDIVKSFFLPGSKTIDKQGFFKNLSALIPAIDAESQLSVWNNMVTNDQNYITRHEMLEILE